MASFAEERLERALGLGEGEGAKAARLVSLIFSVSVSLVMLKSAQNSIFLMAYPRTMIPYAFIASAATLTVASLSLVPLARRLGTARLALWAHAACAVAMFGLRGLAMTSLPAAPFITYVVIEASSGVLLIQAWATVSQATHARSAKRLLPAAGAGATIAWAVVGLLVPKLAHALGTPNLLALGGLMLCVATLVVQSIRTRDLPDVAPQTRRVEVLREWSKAFEFIRALPLLRVMTALSIIALLTEQLMDYLLMSAAHERYSSDAACTAFFGRYYGVRVHGVLRTLLRRHEPHHARLRVGRVVRTSGTRRTPRARRSSDATTASRASSRSSSCWARRHASCWASAPRARCSSRRCSRCSSRSQQ